MVKLTFNSSNRTVRIQNKTLELSELNYQLLAFLYQHKNEVVRREDVKAHLWPDVEMTEDRLEQRLYLLTEALADHGVKNVQVELVSDELVSLRVKTNPYFVILIALFGFIFFSAIIKFVVSPLAKSATIVNNRVVFWSDLPNTNDTYRQAKERWRKTLKSSGMLTYVPDYRRAELTIAEQIASVRAGLVIIWTGLETTSDEVTVKVMEPQSQQILFQERIRFNNELDIDNYFRNRLGQIELLLASELLPLSENIVANEAHPAWQTLREIFKD